MEDGVELPERVKRHLLSTRIWHWINTLAVFVLLMSGLTIFDAHPRLYWREYGANADRAWLEIGAYIVSQSISSCVRIPHRVHSLLSENHPKASGHRSAGNSLAASRRKSWEPSPRMSTVPRCVSPPQFSQVQTNSAGLGSAACSGSWQTKPSQPWKSMSSRRRSFPQLAQRATTRKKKRPSISLTQGTFLPAQSWTSPG